MEPCTDDDLGQSVPTPEALGLSFREETETGDVWARYEPPELESPTLESPDLASSDLASSEFESPDLASPEQEPPEQETSEQEPPDETSEPPPLAPEQFPRVLERAGFKADDYLIEPAALATLFTAMGQREACDLRLGGPVDARVEAFVSANQMVGGVVVHPPRGKGKDVTREALEQALKEAKILRGFLKDSLAALTDDAFRQQLRETRVPIGMIVAYGEPAQDGTDAWLEPLIETAVDRRPQVDDAGNVNFLELGDFPHVEVDQALVRRHPATEGKAGWTVTGRVIKARNGKNVVLKPKNDSVKLAPGDDNLLLAATNGMPVIFSKGAYVEKVLRFDRVGLETGHIRFDGSVQVKGNVEPGMKIDVEGDVKVGGLVEAAHILAGGAIEVGGGVIGRRQFHEDEVPAPRSSAARRAHAQPSGPREDNKGVGAINDTYLKAGTQIKARFVQDATLESDQEIIVQKQVFHSHLKAGSRILLPGRGAIVGGIARAKELIDIGVSGAMANVETTLIAGDTNEIKQRILTVNEELKQIDKQRKQLMAIVESFVKQHKPITGEKKRKFLEAREGLHKKEQVLYAELAELKADFQQCQSARVQIRYTCYPGTRIRLSGHEFSPDRDLGQVTFVLSDGKILMR
ncbi:MAG: DUF342 domain-containing protein [Halochromatium sp.]